MSEKEDIKRIEQKIDDLTEMLKMVIERQNSQYTDIALKINEVEESVKAGIDVTYELQRKFEEATDTNDGTYPSYSNDDELYEAVKTEVIKAGKASTSYIQRKFGIGYARAAGLIEMLEDNEVIGPGLGAKPRKVLITE